MPDDSIFSSTLFSFTTVCERMQESAFLLEGLTVEVTDEEDNKHETFCYQDGLKAFVEYIDEDNPSVYVSSSNYTDLNKKIFFVTNGDDKGLCIIRDNKLHCFYAANFEIEKEHLLNVFSDLPLCTLTLDSYGYPYIGKDCPDTRCQISDSSYNEKYGKTVECFVSNDSTAYNVGVTYYGSVVMQDFTDYAYSGTGVGTYDVGANGLFGTSPPI
jgi:hypothetical protein